jgi:3-deoxy-D-manno-octulosonic-acid transferase
MLLSKAKSEAIGKRAQEFVQRHRGATQRTVEFLEKVIFAERKGSLDRAA